MNTYKIKQAKHFSIWRSCPKRDPRKILMGVYLSPSGEMVATDGRKMSIVRDVIETQASEGIVIAQESCKALAKYKGEIVINHDVSTGHTTATTSDGAGSQCEIIEGTYPKYEAALPQDPHKLCYVDPAYLYDQLHAMKQAGLFDQHGYKKGNVALLSMRDDCSPIIISTMDRSEDHAPTMARSECIVMPLRLGALVEDNLAPEDEVGAVFRAEALVS